MIRVINILIFLSLLAINGTAFELTMPVRYDSLSNGLKVLIVQDTNLSIVSCRLYYFVGSFYETNGISGISHISEHLMFKGTKTIGTSDYSKEVPIMKSIDSLVDIQQKVKNNGGTERDTSYLKADIAIYKLLDKQRKYIKKDEIWKLYQSNGATGLNAWTADDITAYIVTLPANKTELFFRIESDRMENHVLREFYSERDVVTEERRMRYDNKPVNRYWEKLFAKFYLASPYRIPTAGWMSDIRSFTRGKVENYISRFYAPDNAFMILVGNVNPDKAMERIKYYFGPIKPSGIAHNVVTREPESLGRTVFTVKDKANSRIDMLFQIPGAPNRDLFSLDVAENILSGKSGRLYKRLVTEDKTCSSAGASCAYKKYNGYFHIYASLKDGVNPDDVEKSIIDELNKLKEEEPSAYEMMKIKNSIRFSFISKLEDQEGLSDQLAYFQIFGDWRDMMKYPDNIAKVTPKDVSMAIRKYIDFDKATVGRIINGGDKK